MSRDSTPVRETVQATLREYGFADAPLFVTVATEGRGIDELRHHLQRLTSREHASHHRFRLAIDRAFTVKGAGLVVTGTALSGEVNVGRYLMAHGCQRPDACARFACAEPARRACPCRAADRAQYCGRCGKREA